MIAWTLLACLVGLALVVMGAVFASNLRLLLGNRRAMIEAQRDRIRRDTARRLVAVRPERKRK